MTDEQTPAAGPLTAESVALLKKGDLMRDLDGVSIFNDTHDGWVQTIDAKGVRMSFQPKHITFLGRPDQDGWIAWSGGDHPVPGQKVEVRTRKGEIRSAISESFGIMWMADGHESDIIAYRPHVASPASSSSVVQGDASGVSEWNDDEAKRYIADWCPDYVKDYIDRLSTPAPVSRPAGEGEREAGDYTMALAERQAFEDHTDLAAHIERMATTGRIGSMIEWDGFLRSLNVALLSPAAPDAGGGWMPIETAPKDGTKFDGWQRDERVTDMYWSDVQDAWCIDGTYGPEEPTPLAIFPPVTHWRPLPTPPALQPGGER